MVAEQEQFRNQHYMPHRDAQLEELNRLVGRLIGERQADHEVYLREREVLSAMVVDLERLAEAILTVVERTKTRLAGITPSGTPVGELPT